MRRILALGLLLASLALVGVATGSAGAQAQTAPEDTVISLSLTGVVDPFIANYVQSGIDEANAAGDAAVLITIDTPGGLDSSMRKIIKSILASHVPVICYTAPSGARAASAGAFIMIGCPISAMAPGTNIGAAHPVGVAGAIEQGKVTNDAAAYIRSLADQWGRNADWAEQAVRESVSIPAEEAVRIGVVDMTAASTEQLLNEVDGQTIQLVDGTEVTVHTAGATLEERELGIGPGFLHSLFDPNLAFLFFYLGLALIIIEVLHPGVSVPGILGVLLLVTSFVSFGFLPVQLGGVVLLLVSAVFFLAELKHPGLGIPTVGGVVTLILGGLLLFNPSVPNARVSPWVLVAVAGGIVAFFLVVIRAVMRARAMPKPGGIDSLVGEVGVAEEPLAPEGTVRVKKEAWSAESTGDPIPAGAAVRVVRTKGLRLFVEPVGEPAPGQEPDEGGVGGTAAAARQGGGREGE